MSSLEERREARRRKRMQEESDSNRNGLVNSSVREEQIETPQKRQLKANRLSRLAAEVNSFNEEDDYERKRRERREAREARLRAASETVEEDTTSRRSRRRQVEEESAPEPQEDDAAAAEERRRKEEEDAAAAAAAAEAAAAEEEKRRQENEERRKKEAEERERREAEEAQRKIEEEKRAAEDAVRRQAEEEQQKKEEEERKKREAEERRKRINASYKQLVTKETSNGCDPISYHYNIKRDITYGCNNEDDGDDEKDDDDEEDDCDSDFEEGPEKSDTSLELQNHNGNSDNPFCSPVKDTFESCAEIRVSSADPGPLSAAILNNMYPKVANDDYNYKSSNLTETRESTSPDSGKFSFLSVHTNHLEPVPWLKDPKQPDYQTNKRHGSPEKNLIPNRGSNLKDIQKKFEAVSKQEPKEFGKRNINLQENGLISSFKVPSRTLINSDSIKDYKSKLESSLSKTKIQSHHNKLSTESGVKNPSILEDLTNSKNKNSSYNNSNNDNINNDNNRYYNNNNNIITKNNNNNNNSGLRVREKTVKVCNKWPPEKATKVHDISKRHDDSETDSSPHCEPDTKPAVLVSQKSVVKRWPHAQTAQISMAKRPEKLTSWSSGVNGNGSITQRLDYKTDVRGRWPPEVDLKQTARESISSALAQKIYKPPSKDATGVSGQNLRKDVISETAVVQVFLQTPENTRLKDGTSTCKVIPKSQENNELIIPHHSYHNGHVPETRSSLLTNLHAVKDQNLSYTSFVPSTNQHQSNDDDDDDDDDDSGDEVKGQTVSSAHCLIHWQSGKKEEEEREEAERKKRQEEAARRRHEEEEKKKKGKRKGLGGLSPEKKKLLKKLIMQKAAEDLKNEAKRKAEEKERFICERVEPLITEGLNEAQLQDLVKKLHAKTAELEEEVYDCEFKIRRQEFEINDLTIKVNDTRGKFVKPVLKKVSKTEAKLAKLERKKAENFRPTLKSTHESQKEEDGAAEE
ncbi:histone-lysine N-methyltransferase, H3 lysine-79 specific isoform X5 [Octopus sinensis]|uniref:Histone-lysine N-methyltransferase, H3 lysine-79 specific isoform X5 n=1 Tax=Octopus sinensis TaxID=2607531 RepID=A0A7E6EZ83_9MOLL|nr:histone-lysine N-methyltransferase, H3 lysine-79 specific isoform X5 [Octopus sinensis]